MPVTARDCALAISLPLSGDAFRADLSRPDQDFARFNRAKMAGIREEAVVSEYERLSGLLRNACERAKDAGVTVQDKTQRDDLRRLLDSHKVVILISHLRLPDIVGTDIRDGPEILRTLLFPQTDLQRELQAEIVRVFPELLVAQEEKVTTGHPNACADIREDTLAIRIASALQTVHAEAYRWHTDPSDDSTIERKRLESQGVESVLRRMTRIEIEEALGGALAARECIEFLDGMCSVEEFIALIPQDEQRILDMSLCNSAVLSPAVNRKRRLCRMRVGRYAAELAYTTLYTNVLISNLKKGRFTYVEAVKKTIKMIESQAQGQNLIQNMMASFAPIFLSRKGT